MLLQKQYMITILPTFNTLIRRSGHYNAWKLLTCSFPVRIDNATAYEQIVVTQIINFVIGWNKPLKFWIWYQMSQ